MIAVSNLTSGPAEAAVPAKSAAEAGSISVVSVAAFILGQTTSASPSGTGAALGDAEVTQGKSQKGNQAFCWSGA